MSGSRYGSGARFQQQSPTAAGRSGSRRWVRSRDREATPMETTDHSDVRPARPMERDEQLAALMELDDRLHLDLCEID